MSDVAIRAEGISKLYRINASWQRYETLRDHVVDSLKQVFRLNGQARSRMRDIWALKDVSLEVQQGEVVGLIGRNGAGKSTLLKIFSRIIEPTIGFVQIRGRVGSLLEVGTGFHAELSGRENVYLNGAILGMKKREIDARFDEIVAFSGIEQFIDTPVKRYSTGMSVRLAFAVAAHLEPEILLVDEVLAVGDAAFQKKCLGKMGDVAQHGRTVLLVSHNMTAIQSLCTRALLLDSGTVAYEGPASEAVTRYLALAESLRAQSLDAREDRVGGNALRIVGLELLDPRTMTPWKVLLSGQPVLIRIRFRNISQRTLEDVGFGVSFFSPVGAHIFSCSSDALGVMYSILPGEGYTDCIVPKWMLHTGRYTYDLFAGKPGAPIDWVKDAGAIDVEAGDYYGTGRLPGPGREGALVDYSWSARDGVRGQ